MPTPGGETRTIESTNRDTGDVPGPESAPSAPIRPRARGWIHLWALVGSVLPGAALIAVAAATVSGAAAAATAVYVATVFGLFATSATYHRVRWAAERSRDRMRRLDHAMIFVFIAGSYTPLAVLAMSPDTGLTVLIVVWVAALAGVGLSLLWTRRPRWLGVPLYLALGWVAVFALSELLSYGGVAALVLIATGGAIYTVAAVGFATRWPRGWPATFGFHEFFHAATVVAALCHYVAIWLVLHP